MAGRMIDISNFTPEQNLKMLYENSKWNRKMCFEKGDIEGGMFWSGTLNGLYATLDNLEMEFDWLEGRDKDFNDFYKGMEYKKC